MLSSMKARRTSVSERIVPILYGGFLLFAYAGNALSQTEDIPGLEVKVAIFTGKVDDNKNYVEPGMRSGVRLQHGPVYLWTKLTGTEETLAALRSRGKSFPIYHAWTYIGPLGNEPDVPEDVGHDEVIRIGTIKHLSLLFHNNRGETKFTNHLLWLGNASNGFLSFRTPRRQTAITFTSISESPVQLIRGKLSSPKGAV
jgi:hypothetical protein